jgi:hypothetical protein
MNESSTLSPGEERITGIVEKVNFFSESSGFTAQLQNRMTSYPVQANIASSYC